MGGYSESIELFFLHYHSEEEARDKWERRCKRINWDSLLVKFNDQNGCTEEHIRAFNQLPFKNKVCFTIRDGFDKLESVYKIKSPQNCKSVMASYEPIGRAKTIDINTVINNLQPS